MLIIHHFRTTKNATKQLVSQVWLLTILRLNSFQIMDFEQLSLLERHNHITLSYNMLSITQQSKTLRLNYGPAC